MAAVTARTTYCDIRTRHLCCSVFTGIVRLSE